MAGREQAPRRFVAVTAMAAAAVACVSLLIAAGQAAASGALSSSTADAAVAAQITKIAPRAGTKRGDTYTFTNVVGDSFRYTP